MQTSFVDMSARKRYRMSSVAVTETWSVLILSRHEPQAASSRLRTFQFIPQLRAAGAAVTVSPFFSSNYLKALYSSGGRRRTGDVAAAYLRRFRAMQAVRRHSVVWVEKEVFPFLPGPFEAMFRLAGVPYVVDYDDATFHTYDAHRSTVVRAALGSKLNPLLGGAAAVTVGNSYLEQYVRRHGAQTVLYVPTVVDIGRYRVLSAPDAPELRIGWIGTPATTKYLERLRRPLEAAGRRHRLRLVTIGAAPLKDFPVPVEQHPWSAETESQLLGSVHVGVMPLPDEAWERGKCGYKLIQYMAVGRPVIASPVGVNRDIVTPEIGFLASSDREWADALGRLAQEALLRESLGRAGREKVEREYTQNVVGPRIVAVLRGAAQGRVKLDASECQP